MPLQPVLRDESVVPTPALVQHLGLGNAPRENHGVHREFLETEMRVEKMDGEDESGGQQGLVRMHDQLGQVPVFVACQAFAVGDNASSQCRQSGTREQEVTQLHDPTQFNGIGNTVSGFPGVSRTPGEAVRQGKPRTATARPPRWPRKKSKAIRKAWVVDSRNQGRLMPWKTECGQP